MEYSQVLKILDDNNVTHEQLEAMWSIAKQDNQIVKNLSEHGKNWYDLPKHLIEDLIKRYKNPTEQENK